MFDRPEGGDGAVLVHVASSDEATRSELAELAKSAGAFILKEIHTTRPTPEPRHYLGAGKLEELHECVVHDSADLVIFGTELSPSQERNLEAALKCRVIDRTRLILDIFAQRASTYEGKLQVELAQLEHMSTRLVRGWTHLERQKGGIGLRGPGEKQLETDRRLLAGRIKQIRSRLDAVRSRRALSRRARKRAELPVVSLVGYTNAGKSTLFNALTGAGVMAQDLLFATLDPTVRRLDLPGGARAVAADTVGFVRDLPHDLVAAFQATLEESREASLLLVVADASDPERQEKFVQVEAVLAEIGADDVPRLTVFNKIDLVEGLEAGIRRDDAGDANAVYLSAEIGSGVELLRDTLVERLQGSVQELEVQIPWAAGGVRSALYGRTEVLEETVDGERGWKLRLRAAPGLVRSVLSSQGDDAVRKLITVQDLQSRQGYEAEDSINDDETGAAMPKQA